MLDKVCVRGCCQAVTIWSKIVDHVEFEKAVLRMSEQKDVAEGKPSVADF